MSTKFPIYDTEFGYQTNPPETIARAINPTLAAYYMNWAEYISWSDPRVASWDQYLLTDPPPPSNFDTGLEFANGKPKDPMYDAFRIAAVPAPTRRQAGPGARGLGLTCGRRTTRCRARRRPQVANIQFKPSGGGAFKTIQRVTITDAYGYFDGAGEVPLERLGAGRVVDSPAAESSTAASRRSRSASEAPGWGPPGATSSGQVCCQLRCT